MLPNGLRELLARLLLWRLFHDRRRAHILADLTTIALALVLLGALLLRC